MLSSIATKALLPPIRISLLLSSRLTAAQQISRRSVVTLVSDLLLPHTPSSSISTCLLLKPCDKLTPKRGQLRISNKDGRVLESGRGNDS